MLHKTKNGEKKILKNCNLPITGKKLVDMLITEMAVF